MSCRAERRRSNLIEGKATVEKHPRAFEPAVLILNIILSVLGSIIGLQILTTLGVTPNTAIIGVLVALALSRIPGGWMAKYRSIHRQNLVQSTISGATFGAANSLLLPIGIPYLFGRPDLVVPMLIGATMGMFIDWAMLYWFFDSRIFPGQAAWPPGVAAAEAIYAGDEGGKRAWLLVWGTIIGIIGSYFKVSMSAFGVAFIGNVWALTMFGLGLLLRGYSVKLFGFDIDKLYIPHGMMIGAGLVAGIQILLILLKGRKETTASGDAPAAANYTRSEKQVAKGLARGFGLYIVAALVLAMLGGLYTSMPAWQLLFWAVFAAVSCILAEFIVGLSAMHAGWFPAFATALIFLVIGMALGFPAPALALLVGFVASGGPAFADAGYDFKAGWILRGEGRDRGFELDGRWQQFLAGASGLVVAWAMVTLTHGIYFRQGLFPPVDKVYAATIKAGVDAAIIKNLVLWAIPGALIQALGGSEKQLGIMLATGLLILNPLAGYAVLAGILIRTLVLKFKGREAETPMTILAAGFIAGDALYGFFNSVYKARWR
ncbi:OPT/YSL family transporter [Neomoorella thermoacetica]